MTSPQETHGVLAQLRTLLSHVTFPFVLSFVPEGERARDEVSAHITDYLMPRLQEMGAPILAVVGGPTGSGKSTIVNSLLAENVTKTGVLRPTTTAPVLICHPNDAPWFMSNRILPDFARVTLQDDSVPGINLPAGTKSLTVIVSKKVPPGLGIIDSPDIDSLREANHAVASQLFGAADLWIFVTTAARYADFIPWNYLAKGALRNISMVVLLNRIPSAATDTVLEDCRSLFAANHLNVPIFPLEEGALHNGRIGRPLSSFIRWIQGRIADQHARHKVIQDTVTGALMALPDEVAPITKAMAQQHAARSSYESIARTHIDAALKSIHQEIDAGLALRHEVIEQFSHVVGTSQLMSTLQHSVSTIRDTLWSLVRRRPLPSYADNTRIEIESALTSTILIALESAVENTAQSWGQKIRSDVLLEPAKREETRAMIQEMIAQWRDDVMMTVETEAEGKIAAAKVLTAGTTAVGVALMLLLFSTTGGITGGEVVITGGTAGLSHALLQAVFGDQALRSMTAKVRNNLYQRLEDLMDTQHAMMCEQLSGVPSQAQQRDIERCAHDIATSAKRLFSTVDTLSMSSNPLTVTSATFSGRHEPAFPGDPLASDDPTPPAMPAARGIRPQPDGGEAELSRHGQDPQSAHPAPAQWSQQFDLPEM